MKQTKIIATLLITGLTALLISGNAAATTWWFTSSTGNSNGLSITAGGVTATATGIANSGAGGYGMGVLQSAGVHKYPSLGVTNNGETGSSPNHAVDNSGRIDAILLDFGTASVNLSDARFGWYQTDSDFTVAAYTGAGTPSLSGLGYSDLAGNGWELINSYSNAGTSNTDLTDKDTGVTNTTYSSYWIISALNPKLDTNTTWTTGNDYFKLKYVKGDIGQPPPPQTPEPTTLMLLGSVLMIVAVRRRYMQNREACTIKA